MCGIYAIVGPKTSVPHVDKLTPRGPDTQTCKEYENALLYHSRLAIVGLDTAVEQPFEGDGWCVTVNGEIYNHVDLGGDVDASDCAIITSLLGSHTPLDVCRMLDGVFSFVAYDSATHTAVVARDPIGVTPLYYGMVNGSLHVSSLLAAFPRGTEAEIFPPGHVAVYAGKDIIFTSYVTPYRSSWPTATSWDPTDHLARVNEHCRELVHTMEQAVRKRLMGHTPWGVLLSGGLDSTIVAALAVKHAAACRPDYPVVHTFSVGLEDSPDLEVARRVADALGTVHHELIYTVKEGVNALSDVIHAIETYDVTTVRASTPMWLLARFIRSHGVKMVLSGEGADELFAGYKYNEWCPSVGEMSSECIRKMNALHGYDCQRANKSTGDHGVECRVPFLDKDVVDFAMNKLWPGYKMTRTWSSDEVLMEKWLLRRAFHDMIPEEVSERAKAQFSDAVGNRWIQTLRRFADIQDCTEEEWYGRMYFEHFPGQEQVVLTGPSVACSTSKALAWNDQWKHPDPSGDIKLST